MFLKALLYTALSFCFFISAVYSGESGSPVNESALKREKVLILPFRNDSDTRQYGNSGIFREIFSRSFFTFISIVPVIEVPNIGKIRDIKISSSNIQAFSDQEKAKTVIYGRYHLSGNKTNPKIIAELTAYDSVGMTNIFKKTYETTTGPDVFEDIDNMISEVMKGALNIDVKNIAAIHFKDFRIASETYDLYINDRLLASPSGTNFSLVLKVIPETNYTIVLKQKAGERTVLKTDVRLSLNGSTNISYAGFGSVRITGIAQKDRLKNYAIFYDGGQVFENSSITNAATTYTHSVVLLENLINTNYSTHFDLYDNQNMVITPAAGAYGALHAKLLSMDYDMASLIFQYFPFDRYLWLGTGAGFYTAAINGTQYYYISPLIEIGYYWIGDMAYDFRLGTGVICRANLAFAGTGPVPDGITPALFNIGLFISLDYYFITVQPECYIYRNDNGQANFVFTAAAGLHF